MDTRKDTEENFKGFMQLKEFAKTTIKQYLSEYRSFQILIKKHKKLSQSLVDYYVLTRKSKKLTKGFLKNYLEFTDNEHLKIIKTKGRPRMKKPITMSEGDFIKLVNWFLKSHKRSFKTIGFMSLVSYYTGCRVSEILNIKLNDLILDDFTQSEKGVRCLIHGKGNKERYIVIPKPVIELMLPFIESRIDTMKNPNEEPIFKIQYKRLALYFQEGCKTVLNKRHTFHHLRHTAGTRWLNEGKSLLQIKTRLGHSSLSITEVYLHPDEEKELKAWENE